MTQKYGTNHSVNYLEIFSPTFPKEISTIVIVSVLYMEEGREGEQAEINYMTCAKYSQSSAQDREQTPRPYP